MGAFHLTEPTLVLSKALSLSTAIVMAIVMAIVIALVTALTYPYALVLAIAQP